MDNGAAHAPQEVTILLPAFYGISLNFIVQMAIVGVTRSWLMSHYAIGWTLLP